MMKRYVKSAKFWGQDYPFEVHHTATNGSDVLFGGSKTLNDAESIARKDADEIFENPWMSPQERFRMLESIYVVDSKTEEDVTSIDLEEYIDNLMSIVHSEILVNSSTDIECGAEFKRTGSFEDGKEIHEYDEYSYKGYLLDIETQPISYEDSTRKGRYMYSIFLEPADGSEPTVDDIVDVNWFGGESYEDALQRAINYVDRLS